MKSTYSIEDLVQIKGKPGIYTIMQIDAGNSDCTYQVCPKRQYDKWNGDDPDTFPKDVIYISCSLVTKFG